MYDHEHVPSLQVAVEKKLRRRLVRNLAHFCEVHGLHGVDYNWEYPTNREEWDGLLALLKATKKEFDQRGLTATMAYYPDGRQEHILAQGGVERCGESGRRGRGSGGRGPSPAALPRVTCHLNPKPYTLRPKP